MVELEDLYVNTETAVLRKLNRSIEFAKRLIYLYKVFEKHGEVYVSDFHKFFKITYQRAKQIFDELIALELVVKVEGGEGCFKPVKNNGEIVIGKYISECEKRIEIEKEKLY